MVLLEGRGVPLVETCVLLPEELSLKVDHQRDSDLGPLFRHLMPPLLHHPLGGDSEPRVRVCATRTLTPNTRYLPFSGTVRADKLPLLPYLPALDPRQRYGSYDEVVERATGKVRMCNWVRFVSYTLQYGPQVNVVATRVRGSVVFDVVKEIPAGEELVVFLMPDVGSSEENLIIPALQLLRTSLFRRTIDTIMTDAPLDLSRSLVSEPPSISTPQESSSSPSSSKRLCLGESRNISPKRESPTLIPSHHPLFKSLPDQTPLRTNSPPLPFFSPRNLFSAPSLVFPPPTSTGLSLPTSRSFLSNPELTLTRLPSFPQRIPSILSQTPTINKESIFNTSSSSSRSTTISAPPAKRRERTMLPCSECGKAFDRPSLLKRHMRTHTGEKPHVCDVCGKGFSTSSSLNTHRRIHSGEKPHQCGVCGKRFTASSNLYYHKMTHVKEKPHKCTLCTRSFPTPGDLRSHMFVHNGQWPHKCSVCGKGFSKLTNLRNHALLHSDMKSSPMMLRLPSASMMFGTASSSNTSLTSSPSHSIPSPISSPITSSRESQNKSFEKEKFQTNSLIEKNDSRKSSDEDDEIDPGGVEDESENFKNLEKSQNSSDEKESLGGLEYTGIFSAFKSRLEALERISASDTTCFPAPSSPKKIFLQSLTESLDNSKKESNNNEEKPSYKEDHNSDSIQEKETRVLPIASET